MEDTPAPSVDSSRFIEDDDPTITLGGLADDNQEPQLVEQSPIAPLARKLVLKIDEVVAGQAVSFEALPPFLPPKNGFAVGDLRQPSWLEMAVVKAGGPDGNSQDVEDAARALNTNIVAEGARTEPNARTSVSPPTVHESLPTANVQPALSSSSPPILQEKIDTAILGSDGATGQDDQLEDGELLSDNELQLTVVPQANAVDLDQQDLTQFDINAVADRLLSDSRFIEQVGRRAIDTQDVPQRQQEIVAGNEARSVLVINYTQSLFLTIGNLKRDPLQFTRPNAIGHYGHKREVREEAAQDAWQYLVSSGAILGTGFFAGPHHQRLVPPPRAEKRRRALEPYGQSGNTHPKGNGITANGNGKRVSESHFQARSRRPLQIAPPASYHLEPTRPQPSIHSPGLSSFEGAGSGRSGTPKSPAINPARLQMLQYASPVNEPDPQPTCCSELSPLNSGANVAPLGCSRGDFGGSSADAVPQAKNSPTKPRQKGPGPPATNVAALPAVEANQPYRPPQKRGRDQFKATALAKRQLSQIDGALETDPRSKAGSKSMTGLVVSLNGTAAPLARVEAICKYVSIHSPQYFEFARENDSVQWGACIAPSYLNAQVLTLGPTLPTWNEVLGKTTCARQFIEPYLMAGIELYGFGVADATQMKCSGEPAGKRQKLTDDDMNAKKYEKVRDEVDGFVQGIKEKVMKNEPVD